MTDLNLKNIEEIKKKLGEQIQMHLVNAERCRGALALIEQEESKKDKKEVK